MIDTLASRLGIAKGDVLDMKDGLSLLSGDAAVCLALGEAWIIEENWEYFQERGINMEALVSFGSSKKGKGEIDGVGDESTKK